jgi:CRISPR-associated protein Cas1
MWVGEDISKCYSVSSCQSRSSDNFLKQIYLYEHKKSTLLKRYCVKRFGKVPMGDLSEEKIRGIEGAKMKKVYFECALKYGIPYSGRKTFGEWSKQAAYDRAISMGNSFLYGICCAALNALGYSTALGILHSGNLLSLVFDVADLYKIEFTIPMGFEIAKDYKNWKITDKEFDRVVRRRVLEKFQKDKLLNKILSDVEEIYADDMYNKKYKESDENCPDEFPLRNTA